jgi:hypothetical protein
MIVCKILESYLTGSEGDIEENDPEISVEGARSLASHLDRHDIVKLYCKLTTDMAVRE